MKKALLTLLFLTLTFLPGASLFSGAAFAQDDTPGETVINLCPQGQFSPLCPLGEDSIGGILGTIITFIFVVAIIIALVFLIYGGLKWVVSGGDKGKVEEARGTIIAAVIGLVVVFLSYLILNFVLSLFGISLSTLAFPTLEGVATSS